MNAPPSQPDERLPVPEQTDPARNTTLAQLGALRALVADVARTQIREAEVNADVRKKELEVYAETHKTDLDYADRRNKRQDRRLLWILIGPVVLMGTGAVALYVAGKDADARALIAGAVAYVGGYGAHSAVDGKKKDDDEGSPNP